MTTLKTTAEQPAMSQAKRWNVTSENALWAADDGRFVKASDYDALAAVVRLLMLECEMCGGDGQYCGTCTITNDPQGHDCKERIVRCSPCTKALALLGGEKGVGT